MKRIFATLPLTCAAAALALAGCSSASKETKEAPSTKAKDGITVLASFYPLVYLAQQIGGENVSVTNLTPSGEAHEAELAASQVDEIGSADLVVYESQFQPSVDKAIEQTKPAHVIDVASHVDLVPIEQHESAIDTDDHDHKAEHDHDHDHEAEHDHDHEGHHHHHGSHDPHFWLAPSLYAEAIDPIVEQLSSIDKDNADTYKANAEKLRASLTELDNDYKTQLSNCATPTIIVAHEAYGYMADRYGFKQVGVTGINPEQETSAKRLEAVAKVAKDNNVKILFSESALNEKDTKTLSQQLGIDTKVLDPLETQVDDNRDYLAVMKDNLSSLAEAMQCKAK